MSHTTGDPSGTAPPNYSQWYVGSHSGACTATAFSADGCYAASGSADSSLKLFDVARLRLRSENVEAKPVIRTLYDHADCVNDVAFHPNGMVLASCSDDATIKLFDLTKATGKRAFKHLKDAHPISSLSFHPSGDFLAASGPAHALRVHDMHTFQSYTASRNPEDQHTAMIHQVRFAPQGGQLATASDDGAIKLWDTVAGTCTRTIAGAHDGAPVSSVAYSRNGRYVLSSGYDATAKLWEATSGRMICAFEGVVKKLKHAPAVFTFNEAFVLAVSEDGNRVRCWESRTGTFIKEWR
ncbi:hypothetical protein H4R35_006758, partial [Dimargaris xerosporica]